MNESILNALMHLFAIIANTDDDGASSPARTIVESYLQQQLSQELVDEYLQLYDNYFEFHHREIKGGDQGKKRTSLNSVKVLKICQQINEVLHQKEKVIVFIRLLEFVNVDNELNEKELDFIQTVADTFNIAPKEAENIKYFVLNQLDNVLEREKLLLINNLTIDEETDGLWFEKNRPGQVEHNKHILSEHLDGNLAILHIESIDTLVFTYYGKSILVYKGRDIVPEKSYVFDHGSIIKGRRISPIYYSDISSRFLHSHSKTKISFLGENVEFRFKNSKNGIHKFNFCEESGNLVGIMGGSGVGKSTLFNLLNSKIKPNSGRILINGFDIHQNHEQLEGVIGYVPQDDLLIEELTVYQNLFYNAKLCFSNFNEKRIIEVVDKILIDLDLVEIKHLTVGSTLNKFISGGQRKRLNIALELIREPSILFVDEPTSGLSSMDSEIVMQLLKQQALKGKLVIVNIHQPSSDIYKLFDKLWIIDRGGYVIYNGNPLDAIVYFRKMSAYVNAEESECPVCGNVNPEQILQIVEAKMVNEFGKFTVNRKVAPKQWYKLYLENIESKFDHELCEEQLPTNNFKIPSIEKQFAIFSIRNLLSKFTNKQYILINFLEAPVLALILGFFTKYVQEDVYIFSESKNLPAYLFMSVIVALFIGLTVSAEEIIKDRKLLERESFLNLSRFSYINSKISFLFALSAFQAITFVLIGNYILQIQGMTFSYWLILFSTYSFANMIGLNISSGLNSVITIYILIPFILVPQLLLSGVIVNFDDLHKNITSKKYVPVVGDLMTSRWAYEALAVEQFKNNKYQKNFFDVERSKSNAVYKSAYLISELQTKLSKTVNILGNNAKKKELDYNLRLLGSEIQQLIALPENKKIDHDFIEEVNLKSFSQEVGAEVKIYLDTLKTLYTERAKAETQRRDSLFNSLVKSMGKEQIFKLEQDYYNNSLSDMVLNKMQLNKVFETGGMLIQKKDPVFMYPTSNWGRAHFYSPVKKLFGKYIDTFWFNVGVIWLGSILLYIFLLANALKRIITKVENLRLRWD